MLEARHHGESAAGPVIMVLLSAVVRYTTIIYIKFFFRCLTTTVGAYTRMEPPTDTLIVLLVWSALRKVGG